MLATLISFSSSYHSYIGLGSNINKVASEGLFALAKANK